MAPAPELPVRSFTTATDLESWLEAEHDRAPGIWVKLAKKHSSVVSVAYTDLVLLGLCFGWIDGQTRRFDEDCYLQRFTPRRARSVWSQINRDKAEHLIATGRMRPGGLRAIEAAKANGQWDKAYAGARTATVPDDLQAALDAVPAAAAAFAALDPTSRYRVIYRVNSVQRAETRARRIATYVEMLTRGEPIGLT